MYTIYMSSNISLLQRLASTAEFPSYREVRALVEKSEGSKERVEELRQTILSSTPGEAKIFVPYMKDIDERAVTCFATYSGKLGTDAKDYLAALRNYRRDVLKVLEQGLCQKSQTADEKTRSDRVLARTYIWLSSLDMIPLPLMTGMVMDRVWKELEAVKEGYKEVLGTNDLYRCNRYSRWIQVSRWFEAMVDTMKIPCPHTHAVDDYTEALFRTIERERELDARAAVDEVSRNESMTKTHHTTH
jgi:hypothetical protein